MPTNNKSDELQNAFYGGGLTEFLKPEWTEHKPKESRTKLQVEGNRWRLCSLELVDVKNHYYPRLHFHKDIDNELKAAILKVPAGLGLRNSSHDHGINFEGNVLEVALHLKAVLATFILPRSAQIAPARRRVPRRTTPQGTASAAPVAPAPGPGPADLAAELTPGAQGLIDKMRSLDARILQFAAHHQNRSLQPRTRSYCTLFRGSLLGGVTQEAVAHELANTPARALILGANPNNSGEEHPQVRLRYRSLEEQALTGFFSEAHWDGAGRPRPGWDAAGINRWDILFTPLRGVGVSEREIAFANYMPWGSGSLEQLVKTLDAAQVLRMVDLADDLLATVLQITRPDLVIAPLSLSKHLAGSVIGLHKRTCAAQSFRYATAAGTAVFNFWTGPLQHGGHRAQLLHLRHPSSLWLSAESKEDMKRRLSGLLRGLVPPQ